MELVFRRVAQVEFDKSISWYEQQQIGLGLEFRAAVEKQLGRIQIQPQQFKQIRGSVRQAVLPRFPFSIYFWRR